MGVKHPLDTPKIDRIWVEVAEQAGFRVQRSDASYASSNGAGVIEIGARETLDDDDCVAQLVLHELCHAIVQGEDNLVRADWGMDNSTNEDIHREHACLRLQAHLVDHVGMRALFAPTTVVRDHYLELGHDALKGDDQGATIARAAVGTDLFRRWRSLLVDGLTRTRQSMPPGDDARAELTKRDTDSKANGGRRVPDR